MTRILLHFLHNLLIATLIALTAWLGFHLGLVIRSCLEYAF